MANIGGFGQGVSKFISIGLNPALRAGGTRSAKTASQVPRRSAYAEHSFPELA